VNKVSKQELEKRGKLIISAVAVMTIMAAALAFWLSSKPHPEGDLGCIGRQAGNRVAILVDKSDNFTPAQQDELKRIFDEISAQLKQNDLLSVYMLDDPEAMNKKPSFSRCIPEKDANPLYENKQHVEARYKKDFGAGFNDIVEGAISSNSAEASPILEMIQRISRGYYFDKDTSHQRDIYILSDFIQHGKELSFYRQDPDFDSFLNSDYGKRMTTDTHLDGANVHLIAIPRSNISYDKMQKVRKFWIDYLRYEQVSSIKVDVLP
jgi:hypothetical protein